MICVISYRIGPDKKLLINTCTIDDQPHDETSLLRTERGGWPDIVTNDDDDGSLQSKRKSTTSLFIYATQVASHTSIHDPK